MLTKPTELLALLAPSFDMDGGRRLLGQQAKSWPVLLWGLPQRHSLLGLLSGRLKMWSLPGAYAVSCKEV